MRKHRGRNLLIAAALCVWLSPYADLAARWVWGALTTDAIDLPTWTTQRDHAGGTT